MNWDDLRIFIAVARAGQIAKAAAGLNMDATTVSRRLQRLEKALPEVLFERHRDGPRLTEAGQRLADKVGQMDDIMQRLGEADTPDPSGTVRVSASEGFGIWFLARHLDAFADAYPSIHIDLVATSGFLSPSKRETDVAILLARPRKGPLVTRKLTDYGLRLYASRGYVEASAAIRTAADLRQHRLIGYIPDFIYAPELRYLEELDVGLEPHLRTSSINAQHQLAASGAGIAILPCFIGDIDPTLTRILPDIRIQRSFWLVTHRDTRDLTRTRCFLDWIVKVTAAERDLLLGS
ncbi:LysR family transcriptional regulator [Sphingomonas sp. ID0503]|uniref:LysR family transcriptional regulator n=1 Tax=Sphingomonas sp. ID0503 TaxID=3399691 RepID=UPI003AFAD092